MNIRAMRLDDSVQVAPLITELGYPVSPQELAARFKTIDEGRNGVFVAEDDKGTVVGWMHVVHRDFLASTSRGEIVGLVVAQHAQKKGIGKALVQKAIEWTRKGNLDALRVTSNLKRTDSHGFYMHLGFELTKNSAVYNRIVSDADVVQLC